VKAKKLLVVTVFGTRLVDLSSVEVRMLEKVGEGQIVSGAIQVRSEKDPCLQKNMCHRAGSRASIASDEDGGRTGA
jgi:hypothetical protein